MLIEIREGNSVHQFPFKYLLDKIKELHFVKQEEPMEMEVKDGRSNDQSTQKRQLENVHTLYMLQEWLPMENVRSEGRSRSSITKGEETLGMQWLSTIISCSIHRETKDTMCNVLPDMRRK